MATPLPSVESQLLDLTRQLLTAIAEREWTTYTQLSEPSLTCFEPEAVEEHRRGFAHHGQYMGRPSPLRKPTNGGGNRR